MTTDAEAARVQALKALQILDTDAEPEYDAVARLAATACHCPAAVFTLLDSERQWFKARVGIEASGSPRCDAFCAYTVEGEEPFIVEDATKDGRFRDNPFVTGETGLRFYAGFPLILPEGQVIGALAVIDRVPRHLSEEEQATLSDLAAQASALLALRLERNRHSHTARRLAAAQRVGAMGCFEWDLESGMMEWSDEALHLFGVSRETFDGTVDGFCSLVHPDDSGLVREHLAGLKAGSKQTTIVYRVVRPDSTERHIRQHSEVLVGSKGGASVVVGAVHDVTEDREVQRELARSLEVLDFHVKNSPLALIEWDSSFRVSRWSTRAQELFGWAESEVRGKHPKEWVFVHDDDVEDVAGVMSYLTDKMLLRNLSRNRNYTKDGRVLHCEWYNSVLFGEKGELVSIFSLVHDTTAQHAAEQEMADALIREGKARAQAEVEKAYFRSLFEHAPGQYAVLDPNDDYRIMAGSEAYFRVTKTTRASITGRPLFEVFPDSLADKRPDGYSSLWVSLERVRAEGVTDVMAVQRYPVQMPEEEGGGLEDRYWSLLNSPVFGPGGELTYIIHRVDDVTEYIRAKEKSGSADEAVQHLLTQAQFMEADVVLRAHDLQRLNEQLRASEARIRTMFEDAAIGIVSLNFDCVIVEANKAFAAMLGYAPADCVGLNLPELAHPDDRETCVAQIRELTTGKLNSAVLRKRYLNRSGGSVWVRLSVSLHRNSSGVPVGLVAAVEDLTEQMEMEQEIQERSALARLGGHLARVGGWAIKLPENELYWSDEVARLLEWSGNTKPTVESTLDLIGPDYRPEMEAMLKRCAESGTPFDIEIEMITATRRRLTARIRGEAERDGSGRITRLIGAFQDITEQRALESERRRLSERLTATLENMPEAFYLVDLDWKFVYLNRQAEVLLRRRRDELVGRSIWEEFAPAKETLVYGKYNESMRTELADKFQYYYGPLDEWFEIHAYPGPEGLAVYFRAITETLALEEQLRHSQRLETVGQLTGGIAHDFNNLLTVVLGNSELLIESLEDNDALRPFAEMVQMAARRGAELTHRLLAFARRQPLEPRMVGVNALIEGMEPILRRTLGEDVDLRLNLDAECWNSFVDPTQLESALLNLLLNARDAMPTGGRLTVESSNAVLGKEYTDQYEEVQPGEYVLLSVTDTGAGIAPGILSRVFEPFYTTKDVGKGTGLGLSMVYGFIRQSRGHVSILSELGKGTTMKLFLPRAAGSESEVASTGRNKTDSLPRGSETILLVEDDELVRVYAASQLKSLGYKVVEAGNGPVALDILGKASTGVDLLFTDVVMPGGLNGKELATRVRQSCPSIRVLFTSGYNDDVITRQGQVEPGEFLLRKPYSRVEMAQQVRRALDSAGARRLPCCGGRTEGASEGAH